MAKKPAQLAFSYPRRGLHGLFNTVRLGATWPDKCRPGQEVELVDARSGKHLLRARVRFVLVGILAELAPRVADEAHNWRDHQPASERPTRLIESMRKRYPPGRVRDDSVVSVIYLQEIPQCASTE